MVSKAAVRCSVKRTESFLASVINLRSVNVLTRAVFVLRSDMKPGW